MSEAWKVLDIDYGILQEVRAKLREQVQALKPKAVGNTACIAELYYQVKVIVAKIKATSISFDWKVHIE